MENARPLTCIASARLSSHEQIGGDSLGQQVRGLENYAKTKGWELLPDGKVFTEISTAAKRRKLYESHLKYIKENPGRVGYYLVPCIDRFSRGGAGAYEEMKRELASLGVALIDARGIIQEAKNLQELEDLGFEYEWSVSSASEYAETLLSTQASVERKTILERTIPKQIKYTQKGYQVGRPDDGYVNQKIVAGTQNRFIQAPDPERAHFIRKIFELRAENKMTDREILDYLHDQMGFRTKTFNRWNPEGTAIIGQGGGKKIDVKRLQRIYQRFVYAGVLCEKWTHNKPVKAQWPGLVSIELWNQANRGKLYLKEYPDGSLEILYDYKTEKPTFQRLRYNPEYPFKCVTCPECNKPLKGSAPRGRGGKYPRYHCERGHTSFSVSRDEMNKTVGDFVAGLEYDEKYFEVLKFVLLQKLRQRQKDIVNESKALNQRVTDLKDKQGRTLEAYVNTDSHATRELLEKQLEDIKEEVRKAEAYRLSVDLTEYDIEELVGYAKQMLDKPEKGMIDTENPLRQKRLFQLFFEDLPSYEELNSGTAKMRFVFNKNCVVGVPENTDKSQKGRLPGIEPEFPVPQTGVMTVIQ